MSSEGGAFNTMPFRALTGASFNAGDWREGDRSSTHITGMNPNASQAVNASESVANDSSAEALGGGYIVVGIVLSLIMIFILVGNVLVVLSVFTYRPLRIAPNYFIVSLAVTDIAVAVFLFPFQIPFCVTEKWMFGATMCFIWVGLTIMCSTASILHLGAIAVDRYLAIKRPMTYGRKRTLRGVVVTIGILWFVSGATSLFLLFRREKSERYTENSICTLRSYEHDALVVFVSIYFFTLVIMVIVYAHLFLTMRQRLKQRGKNWVFNSSDRGAEIPDTISSGTQSGNEGMELGGLSKKFRFCQWSRESKMNDVCPATDTISRHGMTRTKTIPVGDVRVVLKSENGDGKGDGSRTKAVERCGDVVGAHENPDEEKDECKHHEVGDVTSSPKVSTVAKGEATDEDAPNPTVPTVRKRVLALEYIEANQRVSQSKERRLARTLGLVMGAFIVCWMPYYVLNIVAPLCSTCSSSQRLRSFILSMGYINSAVNPIIYTVFNMDFRRAFKKLLHIGT